ncbi:MAG TPA: UxaA family hydrolase, partial [Terriglobales bacterium]
MRKVLQLDPRDNVVIALSDLKQGDVVDLSHQSYTLVSKVPAKHKFAANDLPARADVIMYGVLVGKASRSIRRGELLSIGDIRHEASPYCEKTTEFQWNAPDVSRWQGETFMGYRRPDGQVGTRNYWLVAPLVFCENRNIVNLKQAFQEELGFAPPQVYRQQVSELVRQYRSGKTDLEHQRPAENELASPSPSHRLFPNIDGIRFLLHEGGCGGTREDSNNLCGLLAGYCNHPNVCGATVLSLGCQNAQVGIFREELARRNPHFAKPLIVLEQQR